MRVQNGVMSACLLDRGWVFFAAYLLFEVFNRVAPDTYGPMPFPGLEIPEQLVQVEVILRRVEYGVEPRVVLRCGELFGSQGRNGRDIVFASYELFVWHSWQRIFGRIFSQIMWLVLVFLFALLGLGIEIAWFWLRRSAGQT